jgi:hypothetical protein
MSENKRDRGDTLAKQKSGNQQPAGTSTHATHRIEQERAEKDRAAQGIAGRQKGEGPRSG